MNESLQHLLASRRPGDELSDPKVAEALRFIDHDEVLKSAVEADLKQDEAIRAALKSEIIIPPDLEATLLAIPLQAAPAVPETKSSDTGNIVLFPRRTVLAWAGAAAAALVTGGYFLSRPKASTLAFDRWKAEATRWANAPKLGIQSEDLATLKSHLASQGSIVPGKLPDLLASASTIGCQCIEIEQTKTSVVCFRHNGQAFHLFSLEAAQVASAESFLAENGAKIWTEETWSFASWKAGSQGHLLLTKASPTDLKSIVA